MLYEKCTPSMSACFCLQLFIRLKNVVSLDTILELVLCMQIVPFRIRDCRL